MTAPNLPQPPVAYDLRDQIELRRLLMQALQAQAVMIQQLETRVQVLEGGPP